ncbi:beta-N-acetylhexosaminidase [Ferrimonas balearica]|uniref:beta-N-acetylhexosaminidase n=1 Tax=Ferrimonas balearica TaxID=44012 RepID=UPI001C9A29D8|nr:beta-N-acetylhexosaminidase [Ferrimonas balearica]MBY5993858.1 beta-N-acetylhexosaminidase [Ferrimonas balearica]
MGPLMADLVGLELTELDRALLDCDSVGGLILFSRNFAHLDQLSELVAAVRARRPELLLAVDHEGGRVQRFREGFTLLPAVAQLERAAEGDQSQAQAWAEQLGWLMASELRAFDIDFSFAPVLDLNGISQVIGERAFGATPESVTALAGAYIDGMHRAGMACVGKHFPGHGSVEADSHLAAPVDSRPMAAIEAQDLRPFVALKAQLEAVMPAHVTYPAVDDRPAGYSEVWLKGVLRERLGYSGLIFSDDLGMAGAAGAGNYLKRVHAALTAGCDIALICNQGEAALAVAQVLAPWPEVPTRVSAMRGRPAPDWASLRASLEWQQAAALAERLRAFQ